MAINVTRVGNTHQKKSKSVMTVVIDSSVFAKYAAAGDYLVGYLPPEAVITDSYIHVVAATGVNSMKLGTIETGAQILSSADTAVVGKAGTFAGQSETATGKPVYLGMTAGVTQGKIVATIEYVEYTKNTGELTLID